MHRLCHSATRLLCHQAAARDFFEWPVGKREGTGRRRGRPALVGKSPDTDRDTQQAAAAAARLPRPAIRLEWHPKIKCSRLQACIFEFNDFFPLSSFCLLSTLLVTSKHFLSVCAGRTFGSQRPGRQRTFASTLAFARCHPCAPLHGCSRRLFHLANSFLLGRSFFY